jgi:CheY-like chemotaxis protein
MERRMERRPAAHIVEATLPPPRSVWIVEDEPAAASLAADLCSIGGASTRLFPDALTFLTAMRADPAPQAVILDWRLEHELSAALFLATRHRFSRLPVIYWTGSSRLALPAMIRDDPWTTVVDKADGVRAFERALSWAQEVAAQPR